MDDLFNSEELDEIGAALMFKMKSKPTPAAEAALAKILVLAALVQPK